PDIRAALIASKLGSHRNRAAARIKVESVTIDELNCWRISHGEAELVVAQQGAHIVSYKLAGQQP
nr:hypothetical protein [Tanacetum cinerariifolium]